jgi:NAD-dependent dihydropyrimidine dehydrogenase PreA subunit
MNNTFENVASQQMEQLISEAQNHRAVNHPYLQAIGNGSFRHMDLILKDFAGQYGFYSEWFPRYLTAVISKLDNSEHRRHLLDNLAGIDYNKCTSCGECVKVCPMKCILIKAASS